MRLGRGGILARIKTGGGRKIFALAGRSALLCAALRFNFNPKKKKKPNFRPKVLFGIGNEASLITVRIAKAMHLHTTLQKYLRHSPPNYSQPSSRIAQEESQLVLTTSLVSRLGVGLDKKDNAGKVHV